MPGYAGVGGAEGGAGVVFDGQVLRVVDADVNDGVGAIGSGGEMDFVPRDAVVGGMEETEMIAAGPDVGPRDRDHTEADARCDSNGHPDAGLNRALDSTFVADAETGAGRVGGGDEPGNRLGGFERAGESVAGLDLDGLGGGGNGWRRCTRRRFGLGHRTVRGGAVSADFGLHLCMKLCLFGRGLVLRLLEGESAKASA